MAEMTGASCEPSDVSPGVWRSLVEAAPTPLGLLERDPPRLAWRNPALSAALGARDVGDLDGLAAAVQGGAGAGECDLDGRRWRWSVTPLEPTRLALRLEPAGASPTEDELRARLAAEEARRAAAWKDLETFTYYVSHDLRAPLRAVEGFAAALLEDCAPQLGELGGDYARRLVAASSRMSGLIDDLLAYNRAVREAVASERVELERVLDECLGRLRGPEGQVPGSIEVARPIPAVRGAQRPLVHAVLHLLRNALHFVPPGGAARVRVRAERRGARVRLWVEDEGIGVPPEHHERIFRPFERLHGIEAYAGSGLGLALVREVADRLGGAAGVESEGEGRGSRFWLELPAAGGAS